MRVDGRVEILHPGSDLDSRIDPAWLEGVDREAFEGRPLIVADSVTVPAGSLLEPESWPKEALAEGAGFEPASP